MAKVASLPRVRRTQEQRSAATRTRLLDATIACLFERGFAGTTTTEIAQRAGVSRGAQLHHFPTRAELVTTAVEHLFERRTEEFRRALARLPDSVDRRTAAVDLLWSIVSGPTFYAWLEVLVAARTDAELRRTVSAIARRFGENVDQTYRELFPEAGLPGPVVALAPMFTFALLQGLALDSIAHRGDPRIGEVLGLLKQLAEMLSLAEAAPRRTRARGGQRHD